MPRVLRYSIIPALAALVCAQTHIAPAGARFAAYHTQSAILPGGRVLSPFGDSYPVTPGPFHLAVSPSGATLAVVGFNGSNVMASVLERENGLWKPTHFNLREQVASGPVAAAVFADDLTLWLTSGSNEIVQWDTHYGNRRRSLTLSAPNGVAGALAIDLKRRLLYVADAANLRVNVLDLRSRHELAAATLPGRPVGLALSADSRSLFAFTVSSSRGALTVLDVSSPASIKPGATVPLGAIAPQSSSPAVLAALGRVFISNPADDSILVVNPAGKLEAAIPLRIPGFEGLRGIRPAGLAYDEASGRLLVAETGINAIGVVDPEAGAIIGHIPAAWAPTGVAVTHGTVVVADSKGMSIGPATPDSPFIAPPNPEQRNHGSVSLWRVPAAGELARQTAFVLEANGFTPRPFAAKSLPAEIQHVVLILKQGRTYDEVLGDIPRAENGLAAWEPRLARFGTRGFADGKRERLSIKDVNVTPNHHALAHRWAFGDNFYAAPGIALSPSFWRHLERCGISSESFGEPQTAQDVSTVSGPDLRITDQERANRYIGALKRYADSGVELPRFLLLRLPNDRMGPPRPADGYPYEESFVADNDLALGRLLEALSTSKWWPKMAVFVAEESVSGGVDHIDQTRTVFLAAGPWIKRDYVSHTNASFAGLLKTIFRLLGAPPLGLADAAASDLGDVFASEPDNSPYRALPVDQRIFDPAAPPFTSSSGAPAPPNAAARAPKERD